MNDSRSYGHYQKQFHHDPPIYSRPPALPPRPPKVRWPPSPSVEDEEISLSREHSSTLPELETSEVRMRGSIDQQPIILEVGKENEVHLDTNDRGKSGKRRGVRFDGDSSDESSGPPTPTDASPLGEDRFQRPRSRSQRDPHGLLNERRQNIPLASPSIQDVIANSVRSKRATSQADRLRDADAWTRSEKGRKPESRAAYAYHPDTAGRGRTHDYFGAQEPQYPGTLEELKPQHRGDSKGHPPYLPFAERHRTMSGSSDAVDHRPQNMRHMSAMGYSGESKAPSFARDHPAHLHSPSPPDPRSAPAFRKPKPHRHSAIDSDSDSEVSPDEAPKKDKRHSRNVSAQENADSLGYDTRHDYPVRPPLPVRQSERPITPVEQRRGPPLRPLPERLKHQEPHDLSVKSPNPTRTTPASSRSDSPRSSIHGTPPQSPRPGSRDGSRSKEGSPVVSKQPQLPRASSPATGIPLYPIVPQLRCADEQHHRPSSLRFPSRPSSPTLHIPGEQTLERQPRESIRQHEGNRPRLSTSPLPAPTPSRSLRPDLRVDVQDPTTPESPMNSWRGPHSGLPGRPVSGDFSTFQAQASSNLPTSAPFWTASVQQRDQVYNNNYALHSAQLPPAQKRPPRAPTSLPACPRPGFVTGYNDWWTLQNAPDLDICPACKSNLEEAGSAASFVPSPPRSTTYKTRCDLSIPWVRMAWLLVLQGKARKTLVEDIIVGIANVPSCPGRIPEVRNWKRLYDPEHNRYVPNFSVCPACAHSVETLFPNLRGRFEPAPNADPNRKRPCAFHIESPRFARYVDLLDEISNQAQIHRREPNMLRFIALARSFADIRPCTRDDQFRGLPWHFHPSLPEFSVCEACYLDVVWPAAARGSDVAKGFNETLQIPPFNGGTKVSCQLYSERMRNVFQRACEREDFHGLRREALMRVGKERELQARVEQAKKLPAEWRQDEMGMLIDEWRRWE